MPNAGHPPRRLGPARRSKASQARRAARRARRKARRVQTLMVALLLGGLGAVVVAGMFHWLGQDRMAATVPAGSPGAPAQAGAWTGSPSGPADSGGVSLGPLSGGLRQAAAPRQTAAANTNTGAPASPPSEPAPPPGRRVATTACANPPCLPFMPGTQVLDDGSSNDGSPGQLDSRSWAATLSSSEPMADVVGYYRQQLAARHRAGDLAVSETSPGPGQLLLTVSTQHDGKQHSVWIGQAGPQVMIRLVTTARPGG